MRGRDIFEAFCRKIGRTLWKLRSKKQKVEHRLLDIVGGEQHTLWARDGKLGLQEPESKN